MALTASLSSKWIMVFLVVMEDTFTLYKFAAYPPPTVPSKIRLLIFLQIVPQKPDWTVYGSLSHLSGSESPDAL